MSMKRPKSPVKEIGFDPMKSCLPIAALALVFGLCLPTTSLAYQVKKDETKKEEPKKEEPQKDPKIADYEKALKDLKRIDGDMTFYQRGREILLELPEEKLGKIFTIQSAFNTGLDSAFLSSGMPVGGNNVDAYRFDKGEGSVWLVRPRIANRWEKDDQFAVGAERQFQEAILGSFRIEQSNSEKKTLLINITPLFFGDLFHLGEMVASGLGGPYMMDREKTTFDSVKGYPTNMVVQMKMHFMSPRGAEPNPFLALLGIGGTSTLEDDRSAPLRVTYNMSFRKDDGYMPREGDPRVGYFDETYFSISKYLNRDRTEHYINRWNLQKKDPAAKMSEPVKPILWTIDPSIPADYRDAIKEGVLRWNKAFEAIGYKNAIKVQDVPKDEKDYDHADGRYNVIRMITTPGCPFAAISLPREDPFTGEILNASITLDGNVIRDIMQEHLQNLTETNAVASGKTSMDVLTRNANRKETDDFYLFSTPQERTAKELGARMSKLGWRYDDCDYASGLSEMSALNMSAILATAGAAFSKEDYVRRFLADCVSHEMGHCLGLRHNFAGSTNLTTAQLADDKLTSEQGITASVMDYTPPNVQAVLKGSGNFFMPTLGSYDLWAIKYGYMSVPDAKTPLGERYALSLVASQDALPGHAYMSDEDVDNWDPYAVKFDLAKDPLNACAKELVVLRRARNYAITNMPKHGESYAQRTTIVVGSLIRSFREGRTAARFVGGLVGSRNFKGDTNEKPTLAPVNPALQRQAVELIVRNFFSPEALDLPVNVMNTLTNTDEGGAWNAPLRDVLGNQQTNLLALLLSANTTDRIAENAYKTPVTAYGLNDHYGTLLSSIFKEVGQNKSIRPLRRDLQRFAINALMIQSSAPLGSVSNDVRMVASDSLKRLKTRFDGQLKSGAKVDEMTRIHLRDTSDSISRFLSRTVVGTR